ncbi:MAG: DNA recombination protein RmuC [Campylobacterota bacterium]|nr:DNA recombination protein RmuC [Campylobacterota bacterium]
MEVFILLSIILSIVSFLLFKKNKSQIKQLEEIDENSKSLSATNQQQEIELAKLTERLSNLSDLEAELTKLKEEIKTKDSENQNLLTQKQDELTTLKEENSKANTSLTEQKDKYEDFKISSDTRLEEIKEELEQSKTVNSQYNEEIKTNKSLISELETKVSQGLQNSQKILTDKENYINDLKQNINNLTDDKKELQTQVNQDKATVSQLQTQLEEQNRSMEEKVKLLQNSEEKLKIEFKNLATEIFENNSKNFDERSQKSIEHILKPMNQQLSDFKKKVEDVHTKDNVARGELKQELKQLKELNQQLSSEAHNLTTALKSDNKKQGNWGEMVLEKVLENSGLREGHEFKREVSLKDDENKTFRPDVIVNLPDNRHIIIDAKTSLNAYSEYMVQEDEILKQTYLKNHIKSMKEHIKGLADKKYENLKDINSLDFIFMFVPIEGALLLALENDVNLYDEAFKQKIILVSPTTLLVALRAVENTWRYERQAQSIADVYKRAEELYKKFHGFIDDLKKVDKGLETARTNYDEAFKKLSGGRGNLISQVTMLKKVSSIKPKKELDSVLVDGAMMDVLEDKEEIGK